MKTKDIDNASEFFERNSRVAVASASSKQVIIKQQEIQSNIHLF